jgi:hypothetical protein
VKSHPDAKNLGICELAKLELPEYCLGLKNFDNESGHFFLTVNQELCGEVGADIMSSFFNGDN